MSAISLIRRIVNHHPLKPETFRTGEKKTGMDEPLILKMNPQNVVGCLIMIFVYPFQEHGIDGVQLSQMVEEDLENLGIPKVFDKLICHLLMN